MSHDARHTQPLPSAAARRARRAWLASLGVLVVLGLGYAGAYVSWGDSLPPGSDVQGLDVSSLSSQEAVAAVQAEFGEQASTPMRVRVVTKSARLDPAEAGLTIDAEASVDRVGRPTLNPVQMLQNRFGEGRSTDLVVEVDEEALEESVASLAQQFDRRARDGAVTFDEGKVVVRKARDGWEMRQPETARAVSEAYMVSTAPVPADVEITEPAVDQDDVDRAVRSFARPAMSGPVTVRNEVGAALLSPAVLGSALTMEPDEDGALQPVLDGEALEEAAGPALDPLRKPARNADVRIQDGGPVVIPAQQGATFASDDLADAVLPALTKKGDKRVARVPSEVVRPSFTTADARGSGVKEIVSEFTTFYPHSADEYRNINIGRAAELLNNAFLEPGEELSFNGTVGQRTPERGFVEGGVIINDRYGQSFGGGISQLVTTTFNAAHFAGFDDVEHHPHTLYIDRYPMGREATVSWGTWDLRFRNNSPHGAVVQAFISPSSPSSSGSVTVRVWSTKHWNVESTTGEPYNFTDPERREVDAEDCAPTSPSRGFDVNVRRVVSRGGTVAIDETLFTRYDPVDEIVCLP